MQIKALTTFRDARGSFRRGMPGDVPDAFGNELIAAKLAEKRADSVSSAGDTPSEAKQPRQKKSDTEQA